MPRFSRLLITSLSDSHEITTCTLALMAALKKDGYQVQHFRSLAAFTPIDFVTPLTGIRSRHLDPWIMSAAVCRELFRHSASHADMSIIETCGGGRLGHGDCPHPGNWQELADVLNCPVLGVIPSEPDVRFHLKPSPARIDALLIDQFVSHERFNSEKAAIENFYGKPVLGGVAAGESTADAVEKMRHGRRISANLVDDLARRLLGVTDMQRVWQLARSRPLSLSATDLFGSHATRRATRVAIAYDACFHCYFPDTLDALEFLGAELCEFSPVADECLPQETDIVFMGCGHPEKHLEALCANECMRAALREHVCAGKRIYAEGGGAAYLCQHIQYRGARVPMVGVLPADAEFVGAPSLRPQPVEITSRRATWMAHAGETMRGYRNPAWRFRTNTELTPSFTSDLESPEVIVRHHCIGSIVHLNFAAQRRALESFVAAHAPSLSI